jgi:tRNA A58 N-methylase Trm61
MSQNKAIIKKAIKAKFGTQRNFCDLHGFQEKDFPQKIKSRLGAIEAQNEFFKPMGLKWELVKIEPDES